MIKKINIHIIFYFTESLFVMKVSAEFITPQGKSVMLLLVFFLYVTLILLDFFKLCQWFVIAQ